MNGLGAVSDFQPQLLGMAWLNDLVGLLLTVLPHAALPGVGNDTQR